MTKPEILSKSQWRQVFKAALNSIDPETRLRQSEEICRILSRHSLWKASSTILFYYPTDREPFIWPLFNREQDRSLSRQYCLPRYNSSTLDYEPCLVENADSDLRSGRFGIMEPAPACRVVDGKSIDLILVPGIGFNTKGVRIGHGKGYYDQICMKVSGVRIGIGFDEQVVMDDLPIENHDVAMDFLVTPKHGVVATILGRGHFSINHCDRA